MNRYTGPNEYKLDAFVLPRKDSFWEAVTEHPEPITELSINYVVPNVFFGGADSTRKALREYKERNNAKNVDIKIRNPDGVDLDDDDVRSSIEYVEGGGANVKAKSGRKTVYNSEDQAETVELPDSTREKLDKGQSPDQVIGRKVKR
ncbi:hypothetical protein I6N98_02295 [Spongiibacter nanhainus]|uniref:Uncharacterized protein n=1 Tax=Spongiibacter nanhainus TaxID=2794344 RepID=A0A7T4R1P0_9GAMM|nr:hypothetical protein [Spongiibacter nanhainus]QQD18720.1 hypothetical protein I6N98_02295 [Spongiibacter nanhainus]